MGSVPIPIWRSSNHHLSCNCENRGWWPPPTTDILYLVQQRVPPRYSQRLGPLGLYTNVQPNAAVRVYGRQHWLQKDSVFQTNISPLVRLNVHRDCKETISTDTLWRHYIRHDAQRYPLPCSLHHSCWITKEESQSLIRHCSPLVLAPTHRLYCHTIVRHPLPLDAGATQNALNTLGCVDLSWLTTNTLLELWLQAVCHDPYTFSPKKEPFFSLNKGKTLQENCLIVKIYRMLIRRIPPLAT